MSEVKLLALVAMVKDFMSSLTTRGNVGRPGDEARQVGEPGDEARHFGTPGDDRRVRPIISRSNSLWQLPRLLETTPSPCTHLPHNLRRPIAKHSDMNAEIVLLWSLKG